MLLYDYRIYKNHKNVPEFNSLTSDDMAFVTLSAAIKRSFLKDRPKLLLALLEPLPGKLLVLNADLISKIFCGKIVFTLQMHKKL